MSSKDDFFDWAYDTKYHQGRSNKIAWALVVFFACIAVLCVVALAGLTPLKEKVPFIFSVDKSTGIIEARTMIDTFDWIPEQAEDYANAAEYILLRESYLRSTYVANYRLAVQKSTGIARQTLIASHAPDAPLSPILEFEDKTQVDIRFKSVAYHGSNNRIAIVRYIKDIRRLGETTSEHYIATIQFDYATNQALSLTSRLTNPHAFVVTNYQNVEEGFQQ